MSSYEVARQSKDAKMVIDESVIIVSVILSRDNAIQGKEESIIEELSKARKDSSGFHLEIKTQDTTCDSCPSLEYANTSKKKKLENKIIHSNTLCRKLDLEMIDFKFTWKE